MEILKLLLGKPGSSTNYEIIDKNFFKVKYSNSHISIMVTWIWLNDMDISHIDHSH